MNAGPDDRCYGHTLSPQCCHRDRYITVRRSAYVNITPLEDEPTALGCIDCTHSYSFHKDECVDNIIDIYPQNSIHTNELVVLNRYTVIKHG